MREIPIHVTYTLTRETGDGRRTRERLAVRCADSAEARRTREALYNTPGTSYVRTNRSGRLTPGTRLTAPPR